MPKHGAQLCIGRAGVQCFLDLCENVALMQCLRVVLYHRMSSRFYHSPLFLLKSIYDLSFANYTEIYEAR